MERSNWKRPRNYHSWTHHNGHCCWKTLTNWMCVQIITHHCHSDRHRCAEIFVNTSNMVTSTWTNHRIRARTKLSLGSNAFWNAKRLDIPAHWIQKSQVCLKQFCFSFSLSKSQWLYFCLAIAGFLSMVIILMLGFIYVACSFFSFSKQIGRFLYCNSGFFWKLRVWL